jgi:hypothetical protein
MLDMLCMYLKLLKRRENHLQLKEGHVEIKIPVAIGLSNFYLTLGSLY